MVLQTVDGVESLGESHAQGVTLPAGGCGLKSNTGYQSRVAVPRIQDVEVCGEPSGDAGTETSALGPEAQVRKEGNLKIHHSQGRCGNGPTLRGQKPASLELQRPDRS